MFEKWRSVGHDKDKEYSLVCRDPGPRRKCLNLKPETLIPKPDTDAAF
jgi:hypothetical protein